MPSAQVPPVNGGEHDDSVVTSQPAGNQRVLAREEKVEYRDQDGNLLNEEQVKSLEEEGKVTFKTKYETRTRLVDAQGNVMGGEAVAPPHPDVQGQDPDTSGLPGQKGKREPAEAEMRSAGSVPGRKDHAKPKPASDASEATKKNWSAGMDESGAVL